MMAGFQLLNMLVWVFLGSLVYNPPSKNLQVGGLAVMCRYVFKKAKYIKRKQKASWTEEKFCVGSETETIKWWQFGEEVITVDGWHISKSFQFSCLFQKRISTWLRVVYN